MERGTDKLLLHPQNEKLSPVRHCVFVFLTRSCCSWSGQDGTDRSGKSEEHLQWWPDISGRCTSPAHEPSRGYDTGGTNVCGAENHICWIWMEMFPFSGLFSLNCPAVRLTCLRSSQSPRQRERPDRDRSRSSRGASSGSWPWSHGQWWTRLGTHPITRSCAARITPLPRIQQTEQVLTALLSLQLQTAEGSFTLMRSQRVTLDSPHWWQQGANSIWKSCSQYFLPSNWESKSRTHASPHRKHIILFLQFSTYSYPHHKWLRRDCKTHDLCKLKSNG